MADEDKKIIVDEDWKAQAQKEKENMADKEQESAEAAGASEDQRQFPQADMTGLISMLATQALVSLGAFSAEEGQEPVVDLGMAKYSIDMLGVIQDKTKGNLTDDEAKALEGALHQLRMTFVAISKGS